MHDLDSWEKEDIIKGSTGSNPFPVSVMLVFSTHTGRISMKEGREMFYLTTHSTHFIYGYMASDIW